MFQVVFCRCSVHISFVFLLILRSIEDLFIWEKWKEKRLASPSLLSFGPGPASHCLDGTGGGYPHVRLSTPHWVPCARGWSWTRFLGIYTLYYRDFRWKRCRGLLPYPQQKTPTLPTWQPTTHMASTARALEAGRNAFRRPWELQPHPSVVRGFWRPWCQPACFVGSSLCLGDVFSQTVTKIRKPTSMMDDPATKYG